MRQILPMDLDAAVRVALCGGMQGVDTALWRAHVADKRRKKLGRGHPVWGNGTLGDAARSMVLDGHLQLCGERYCDALGLVLQRLGHWRSTQSGHSNP